MNSLTQKLALVDVCLGPGLKFNIFSFFFFRFHKNCYCISSFCLLFFLCFFHKQQNRQNEIKTFKRINVENRMLFKPGGVKAVKRL